MSASVAESIQPSRRRDNVDSSPHREVAVVKERMEAEGVL